MYTQCISCTHRVKMQHFARPNTLTSLNYRPEFKWKHLPSVISKEIDIAFFQIDKATSARCPTSREKRQRAEEARSPGTRWAPTGYTPAHVGGVGGTKSRNGLFLRNSAQWQKHIQKLIISLSQPTTISLSWDFYSGDIGNIWNNFVSNFKNFKVNIK